MSSNTIIGTIGSDIRRSVTGSGTKVASFRLAKSERRFDQATQQWTDGPTSWLTIVAFRGLAEHAAASLKKGQRIIVEGELRVTPWERDGKSGLNVEVIASDLAPSLLFGTAVFQPTVGGRAQGEDLVAASLAAAGAELTDADAPAEDEVAPEDEPAQ